MELGLKGKNVLITGSTNGLGKAIAQLMAQEGANVVINGRNKEKANKLAEDIRNTYKTEIAVVPADLSEENAAEDLFRKSVKALGKIDVLVNNAGIWPTAYVRDMEKKEFERTIYMDLEVPYILSRMMVNHLISREEKGKIINVVSQAAFHGSTTGHAHYAAAKSGLVTFMISLAREVAKYGITVNAVAPGITETDMMKAVPKNVIEPMIAQIPLRRLGQPEDIANAFVFLASDEASYITGVVLSVDGMARA